MDQSNNEFNSNEHLKPAIKAAVYYLFIYIPILLPLTIWKDAAVSLTNLWQSRSVSFNSRFGKYPLWSLLYKYVVTFVFDAAILLAWPFLLYQFIFEASGFSMIGELFSSEYISFVEAMKIIITGGLAMYGSVLGIRLAKESLKFVLENLVAWILDVLHSIGQMLVNVWKFNIVIRRKEG